MAEQISEARKQIRLASIADSQAQSKLLELMTNLESMTDTMYTDLKEELNGISKNLEKLNGDFFKGIIK